MSRWRVSGTGHRCAVIIIITTITIMSKCIYHKNDEEDESDVSSDVDGNEDDEYPLVDPEGGRCVEGRCQDASDDSMPDTDQTDRHHRRQNVEVLCVCVYIYIVYI